MDKRAPPPPTASSAATKTRIRSIISTSSSKFPNKRNWQTLSHGSTISTKIQSEVPVSNANKLAGNCSTKILDRGTPASRKQIKLIHSANLPKTKSAVTLTVTRNLEENISRLTQTNFSACTFNVGIRKTSTPKHRVLSNLQPLKREKPIETSSLRLKKNLFTTPKILSTQTSGLKPGKPTLSKFTPSQTPLSGEIKIPKIFVNAPTSLNKKSTISSNNINNNSLTAINRNLKTKGNRAAIKTANKGIHRSSDAVISRSRGQGPSGSKTSTTGHHPPLKSSSSVSSLDGIGIKLHSTKIKNHGSKDKIDQNLKNSKDKLDKGSKERVADFTDPVILPKSKKKNSPMPIIQQHAIANNNLIDERESSHHHTKADKNSSRDLANINFDGTRENSHQSQSIMQDLQSHLERLTREKMALEAKVMELSSYQTEVVQLRTEIIKLQNIQEKSNIEIQKLTDENETLRNRLRDVVNSPLSDAEKHQIIQESQRLHSSAPASIALPNNHEADGTPCVTPDWDKHSSSSEISVACLQDKIIQMEETHYSTNEELQATLQELADLQNQLSEIQSDNERLAEEKDVLFQSLCRQTEKLEDSRTQIGTLQELLLRESNQADVGTTEREQKLYDLLKNAQEERENLLVKQEELNSELNELRQALENSSNENSRLRERISWLDSTVDAATAERKQIESQLTQAKENSSEKQIEISRLTTLLENARAKIDELEQDRAMGEKSDLGELLDVARKEKDALEGQVASLQEQVSKSHCEIQKLKDQLAALTEECKVARNNAKCALSDLEYRYETVKEEKHKLSVEYQQLQDSTNELQVQCKCHLEDKSQLESLLSETQRHLGEAERLLAEKEERLQEEIKLRKQEAEEWEQFQSDLLMTVRVANDFKTEAQSAREQLVMDNKTQREKIRMLEQQIEKLNKQISSDAQQSLLTTVQQEMAARRQKVGISRQDSRLSVKSLIESIENVNKQTKGGGLGSRCSSSSSLNSVTSDALNGGTTQNGSNRTANNDWSENAVPQNQLNAPGVGLQAKSPLREQQQTAGINITLSNSQKTLITGERKDPLNALVKNGGSKRNALLKWCQNKTVGYRNIDITNFSSSWNDGLAFCAILHSYLPDRVPYDTLGPNNKRRNFSIAFSAAESVGIPTSLNINEMCQQERPDWTQVMAYVTAIYKHFET